MHRPGFEPITQELKAAWFRGWPISVDFAKSTESRYKAGAAWPPGCSELPACRCTAQQRRNHGGGPTHVATLDYLRLSRAEKKTRNHGFPSASHVDNRSLSKWRLAAGNFCPVSASVFTLEKLSAATWWCLLSLPNTRQPPGSHCGCYWNVPLWNRQRAALFYVFV